MIKLQRWLVSVVGGLMLMGATTLHANNDDDEDNAFRFTSTLTGAQETGTVDSNAGGFVSARFDQGLTKVDVKLRLRGINSMVVAAHFHCARAGVNGPVAFGLMQPGPLTEIGERARVTLTNENFSGADCTALVGRPVSNIAALYFAMRDGLIYLNVHTPDFPGGEVRGQMIAHD